ncbi:MAG: hypothetical protein HRU15_19760, partial [Planctomycetes bacterium]|nr:hypothetical protein [Planctomycetota bacterium]
LALNFWKSTPVQKLVQTPGGMMALQRLPQEQPVRGLLQFLQSPAGQQVSALLLDAVDQEMFVATDARTPQLIHAFLQVYNSFFLAGLENGLNQQGGDLQAAIIIDLILKHRNELGIPAGMFGLRLRDAKTATTLLDGVMAMAAQLPPGMHTRSAANEAWAHHITIPLQMLVATQRMVLTRELQREGVPAAQINQLFDWLNTFSIHINLTVRDNYLLLHIGPDRKFIDSWGAADTDSGSLAASKDFQAVRSLYRESLVSVSYHNTALMGLFEWTAERIAETKEQLTAIIKVSDLPADLSQRLLQDLTEITEQVVKDVPNPAPFIACSFAEQGMRSYTVRPGLHSKTTVDTELHLTALSDTQAMLSSTQNTLVRVSDVDVIASVLQKLCGYFEDFALEKLGTKDQANARIAITALRKFGTRLLDIAKGDLFTAMGESSMSTMVIEKGGTLTLPPGMRDFPKQLTIPRFGLAMRLQESAAFVRAVIACKVAVLTLADDLKKLPDSNIPAELSIPDPTVSTGGGDGKKWTSYTYATPLGADVQPTAIITKDLLLVGLSPQQLNTFLARDAEEKLKQKNQEKQEKHAMSMRLNVGAWAEYAFTVGKEIYEHQNARRRRHGAQNNQQDALVMMHIQILVEAIQHIEAVEVVQKQRADYAITESWIRIR